MKGFDKGKNFENGFEKGISQGFCECERGTLHKSRGLAAMQGDASRRKHRFSNTTCFHRMLGMTSFMEFVQCRAVGEIGEIFL